MSVIRVVDILTDRELALSGGITAGLAEGDILRILPGTPREIRDPDTDEVLGQVAHAKAVVQVYESQEKFCLARTFRTRRVNVGGTGGAFGNLFSAPQYEHRVETLERDPQKGSPIDPDDVVVEIGDIAEKVDRGEIEDLPTNTLWK